MHLDTKSIRGNFQKITRQLFTDSILLDNDVAAARGEGKLEKAQSKSVISSVI